MICQNPPFSRVEIETPVLIEYGAPVSATVRQNPPFSRVEIETQ